MSLSLWNLISQRSLKQNIFQTLLNSYHIEGGLCLKYVSHQAHTFTYISYVYVRRCTHAETKFSTKTPLLLLPCGLMNDKDLFPNHILKELNYESRQYLAISKHPFVAATHSLQ